MNSSPKTRLKHKRRISLPDGIGQSWIFPGDAWRIFTIASGKNLLCRSSFIVIGLTAVSLYCLFSFPSYSRSICEAEPLVCGSSDSLFRISSFIPSALAVRIGPDLLVTNRLNVADEAEVKILLDFGKIVTGSVIPTSYEDDLILISSNLPDGPALELSDQTEPQLYHLGLELQSGDAFAASRVEILSRSIVGKQFSKIYFVSETRPKISSGVLVNTKGALVGIIASDLARRTAAIGHQQIEALKNVSGSSHVARSRDIGFAYRRCHDLIAKAQRNQHQLSQTFLVDLKENCFNTKNQDLMDQAAMFFIRSGQFVWSEEFFNSGLQRDPNAINTRLSLVELLLMMRKYRDALPHIRHLINIVPEEAELQSFALQTGRFVKDQTLVSNSMELIRKHNPQLLEAAQQFLNSDPKPSMRGSFN